MSGVDWKPYEKGIYVRDYGEARVWQVRAMVKGRRYVDTLGVMPIEEARIIRDLLARNRKLGAGPLTWVELQMEEREKSAAKKIEESQKRKEEIRREMARRTNTVAKLWEEAFFPHRLTLKRSVKESKTMEGRWINHIKPHFGDLPIENISAKDFESFARLKRDEGVLSETTIFKCLVDLRQAWAWGAEEGLVSQSFPGKRMIREIRGRLDNEKKCYLEPEEARLLIQTSYERRLKSRVDNDVYCFIMLGLGLGLRAGEICGLTRQSVERHIIERTKNKKSRFVHFSFAPVQAMIQERLALYPPASPQEPLFLHKSFHGVIKARTEPPRKFFDLVEELGFNETERRKGHHLEKIDFHALRHTFATFAAMRGVDHLTLMRLMGHKTPAMTLRYIEIADAHQAKHQEKAMAGIFPPELEIGNRPDNVEAIE